MPWANDGAGNQLWWLPEDGWVVVVNEARGEGWEHHEGAVAMLVGLVSGELESEFLTVQDIAEGFVAHVF